MKFEDWYEANKSQINACPTRRELALYVWDNKPPELNKAQTGYGDEFNAFWAAYPKNRRVGKGAALKSFQKAIKAASLKDILDALAWQVKSEQWTKDNGQFIPMPTTYLNQRRWEDDRPDEPTKNGERYQDMNGIWRYR